ncbi:MAG: hypothetical protein HY369_02000 [Candidatus Aenigmarchaeota archaeon]|nr:hypothetical protein [Candidatus Aenigmarchaeota archaeon]
MLRYWRVWLLVIMVLASVFAIGLKTFPYGRDGVQVVYVAPGSPAKTLLTPGMVITEVNGQKVMGFDDWMEKTASLSGAVTFKANGQPVTVQVNETLGVNAVALDRTNLDFGLDLKGGTRIILQPAENVTQELLDETVSVLETRANLFGLQEIKLLPVKALDGSFFIQIEAAGVGGEVVDELLSRQGKFEAKMIKPVTGTLEIGDQKANVTVLNSSILVGNQTVPVNGTFVFGGIPFQYLNTTNGQTLLLATVFAGEDIELVYTDPQRSGILPQGDVYQFYFGVLLSQKGAERFAQVTKGIPSFFDTGVGQEYLETPLILYIDGEVVSTLQVAGSLAGQAIQDPQISGSEPTQEGAIKEKLRLQTILKSGALPVALQTVSADVISPTLGSDFFSSAILAVAFAALVVLVIVYIRYRSLRISVPLTLVGISEVIIILGIAATNDAGIWAIALVVNLVLIGVAWWKKHGIDLYAWIGAILVPLLGLASWTIDLPAIAGIMAAIGASVDHQIIIADEARRGSRRLDMKDHIKRALFIIMGSAATMIAAMLPLMFIGVGLVRGFAITSIVGVLAGVLVTRPAYARIVEGWNPFHKETPPPTKSPEKPETPASAPATPEVAAPPATPPAEQPKA